MDIARCALPSIIFLTNPDLHTYISLVQEYWPRLNDHLLTELTICGKVFRCLAAMHWEMRKLAPNSVVWPIRNMCLYDAELAHAMGVAEWR